MLYRRKGTELYYDVTNPALLPLYEDNEMYEQVDDVKEEKAEKPKKTKK